MAHSRPQNTIIIKITMITDRPTSGSRFLPNASFSCSGFFHVARGFSDDGFAAPFSWTGTGRGPECDVLDNRPGLGLALGEPGWLDPFLIDSNFRRKDGRFGHVFSLEVSKRSECSRLSRLFRGDPYGVWNKKATQLRFSAMRMPDAYRNPNNWIPPVVYGMGLTSTVTLERERERACINSWNYYIEKKGHKPPEVYPCAFDLKELALVPDSDLAA